MEILYIRLTCQFPGDGGRVCTVARLGRLAPSPRLVMFSNVVPTSSMKLAQGDASCVVGKVYSLLHGPHPRTCRMGRSIVD
jgi:hypothetical protein